jgi:hypothetical protein
LACFADAVAAETATAASARTIDTRRTSPLVRDLLISRA